VGRKLERVAEHVRANSGPVVTALHHDDGALQLHRHGHPCGVAHCRANAAAAVISVPAVQLLEALTLEATLEGAQFGAPHRGRARVGPHVDLNERRLSAHLEKWLLVLEDVDAVVDFVVDGSELDATSTL
jgi:hypothetical protein